MHYLPLSLDKMKAIAKLNCVVCKLAMQNLVFLSVEEPKDDHGGLICDAPGGGGADAGDVGEGRDVRHTHQRPGEVDAAAGHASASGHA